MERWIRYIMGLGEINEGAQEHEFEAGRVPAKPKS